MTAWAWRTAELVRRALLRFYSRSGSRSAAAVAYYVLLSLFPLVLVLVAAAGVILTDDAVREEFVEALVDSLPVTTTGADSLDAAVRGIGANAGTVGALSLLGLVWTASGMMAALRGGLDDLIGDVGPARPFLQGKLVDLAMLLLAALLLAASAGATIAERVAREQVIDPVGLPGTALTAARVVLPVGLAFAVLVILLRWVPSRGPRLPDLWPAALGAAIGLWALTLGFAFFVDNFGRYNLVYGSLAAVVVFLVYVYVSAYLVFMAASVAVERAKPVPAGPPVAVGDEVRRALRGLALRERPPAVSVDEELQQHDQEAEREVDPRDEEDAERA